MSNTAKKIENSADKPTLYTEIRKKLGITQAQLASIFGISRAHISLVETGKRNLQFPEYTILLNLYLHFHELETGKQSASRSPETKLFLNNTYKKVLPEMRTLEQEHRLKIRQLKNELEQMKERARDAEHAVIVFSTAINDLKEQEKPSDKIDRRLTSLDFFKQQAYNNLLTCWEPEQAKLHGKIEAIAGEAKALRRYRTKVMREHKPV